MSHLFFSFLQPVVGTLVKFPIGTYFSQNHTFQLAIYGPQLKFQFPPNFLNNTLNNIFSINYWHQSHGILGNFAIGPAECTKLCLMYGQTGNF